MNGRAPRPWVPSFETIVFGVSIVLLGSLTLTWTSFFRRLILENHELKTDLLHLSAPDDEGQQVLELALQQSRRLLQVIGEGSLFFVLLLVCVVVLFIVARDAKRAKEKMERMLAMTTHELKTPIAGVKALLQSLQLGSVPAESQTRLLASGVSECNRLEHLAETILSYQRAVLSDQGAVEKRPAHALVRTVLEHRKQSALDPELSVTLLDDGDIAVEADALRVIIENLLDNAGKYGGRAPVQLTAGCDESGWTLSIKDQGVGFEQAHAAALFEPFARGNGVEHKHGSGLGLFIARQLARRMGGDLTATSPGPGLGATFTLRLRRV